MNSRRRAPLPGLAAAGACLALALAGCGAAVAPGASPVGLVIVAENLAFDPAALKLPARTPIHVTFENRDAEVPHGIVVALRTSGVEPPELGRTEILTGIAETEFDLLPLEPGPYLFSCPIHPNMQVEVDVG